MYDEITRNDEMLFDRLVDGELSDAQRRRLLGSLDDLPGGWRRCALAFLEAQAWRGDLGQVVRDSEHVSPTTRASESTWPPTVRGLGFLAMAASVLAAFTLGWAMHGSPALPGVDSSRSGQIAATTATPSASALGETREQQPSSPRRQDDALTFFVRNESGKTHPVRVPLVDAGELDRRLGLEFQTGWPDHVRDQLEDRGYQVQSKRRYAPLLLENGRRMIVPVEDTRIVPVGQAVY